MTSSPPPSSHASWGSTRRPLVFGGVAVLAVVAMGAAVVYNGTWWSSLPLLREFIRSQNDGAGMDAMIRTATPRDPSHAADWEVMAQDDEHVWTTLIARYPEVKAFRWAEWRRVLGDTYVRESPYDEESTPAERLQSPAPRPLSSEDRSAIEIVQSQRAIMAGIDRDNGWLPLADAALYAAVSIGRKYPKDGRTSSDVKNAALSERERTVRIPKPRGDGFVERTYYLSAPPYFIHRVDDPARAVTAARLLHDAVRRPRFTQDTQSLLRWQSTLLNHGEGPRVLSERVALTCLMSSGPRIPWWIQNSSILRLTGEVERRAYREAGKSWPPDDAWSMAESPESPAETADPSEQPLDPTEQARLREEKRVERERALASDAAFLNQQLPVDPAIDPDHDGLSAEDIARDLQTLGARLIAGGERLITQWAGVYLLSTVSNDGARIFRAVGDDATAERLLARGRRLIGGCHYHRIRILLELPHPEYRILDELDSDPTMIAAAYASARQRSFFPHPLKNDFACCPEDAMRSPHRELYGTGGYRFLTNASNLLGFSENPAAHPTWEEVHRAGGAEYIGTLARANANGGVFLWGAGLFVFGAWWFSATIDKGWRVPRQAALWPSLSAMLAMGMPAAFFALIVPMLSRWDYILLPGVATLGLFPLWGWATAAWWLAWMSRRSVWRVARGIDAYPLPDRPHTGEITTLRNRTRLAGLAWGTVALMGLTVAAWRLGPGWPEVSAPPEPTPVLLQRLLMLSVLASGVFALVDGVLYLRGARYVGKGTDFLWMGRLRHTVGGLLIGGLMTAGIAFGLEPWERQASGKDVLITVHPDAPWIGSTGLEGRVIGVMATEARRALVEEEALSTK